MMHDRRAVFCVVALQSTALQIEFAAVTQMVKFLDHQVYARLTVIMI